MRVCRAWHVAEVKSERRSVFVTVDALDSKRALFGDSTLRRHITGISMFQGPLLPRLMRTHQLNSLIVMKIAIFRDELQALIIARSLRMAQRAA